MTPAGVAKFDVKGRAGGITSRTKTPAPHPDFEKALKFHPKAGENFERLAPSHRRMYLLWIRDAKKEETRARRIAEAVERLALNQKLGMK